MSQVTRQRHYGADGEVKFVAHRNLYVGFWGGKVRVTKRTAEACAEFLARTYSATVVAKAARPVVAKAVKPVTTVGAELQEFVSRQNAMARAFKSSEFSLDTAEGRQHIAESIDAALSPENLSCDGELPRATVQAKYRSLTRAAQQLLALDPTVKFYEFAE